MRVMLYSTATEGVRDVIFDTLDRLAIYRLDAELFFCIPTLDEPWYLCDGPFRIPPPQDGRAA